MKLQDVVSQLQVVLPKYTDRFSTILPVASIVASGGVATITTNLAHNIKGNNSQAVTISEVQVKTGINSVSQDGLVFTFGTSSDHDLTEGWDEHSTVALTGFTDEDWNDSFSLVSVPNRRTFKVQSTNTLPVLNGNEKLLENRVDGVNGRYAPTVIDSTSFSVPGDFIDGEYTGGNVGLDVRVAGIVNPEEINEYYTAQQLEDFWMFVSMPDAVVSKDRNALSDAVGTMATGQDIRLRILDGFNITVIKNTSEDISAIEAIDVCRHDLLLPVLKSVFGAKFDTGLSSDPDFKAILTGHGVSLYNRAYIEYTYSFEVAMDLTNDDTVEPENTRAFRDVDYTHTVGGDDTPVVSGIVNLDDEPA